MQIPTVPSFVTGDYSLTKLQQLSQCVAFLTNAQRYPMWHVYSYDPGAVLPIGASSWTTMPMYSCAFDSDQVWDSLATGGIHIRTQGYYVCEACIPFLSQSGLYGAQVAFQFVAGPYNPHYSNGTSLQFGLKSGQVIGVNNGDEVICTDDMCPVVCYPGDFLAVQVWGSAAFSVNFGGPTSAINGRFTCNFTGRWVRTGS